MIASLAAGHPVGAVQIADVAAAPTTAAVEQLQTSLSSMLTDEFDAARHALGVSCEELLLAALGGAVAKAFAGGVLRVSVTAVDGTTRTVLLDCVDHHGLAANETLIAVRRLLCAASAGAEGAEVALRYGSAPSGAATLLEVAAERAAAGAIRLSWRFDSARLATGTVNDLAEQFPRALIEVTSEAVAPVFVDTEVVADGRPQHISGS